MSATRIHLLELLAESGHIRRAVSVPLRELKRRLAKLPKRKEIVAYCRGRYCVLLVRCCGPGVSARGVSRMVSLNGGEPAFRSSRVLHEVHE